VQVVTEQMLEDLGATSLEEILQYTTNTDAVGSMSNYTSAADGVGDGTLDQSAARQDPSSANRVRGLAAPTRTTNYFESSIPFDSYNSGRIDINRGANSFLFGLGSPGGIINQSVAQASFRDSVKISHQISTEDFDDNFSNRISINLNKVLIEDKLSIRFAAVEDNKEFKQQPAATDSSRRYVALKFKPFGNRHIIFNANYETGNISAIPVDRLGPLTTLDTFLNDPYGTVWGSVDSFMGEPGVTNAAGRRIGNAFVNILSNSADGRITYLGTDINGVTISDPNDDVFLKRNGWASVFDGNETAEGLPTRAVHTGWTNNRIRRGSPTFDPDRNLTGNNESVISRNIYLNEINLDAYDGYTKQGLLNYDVFDFSKHLISGSVDNYKNDFDRSMFSLEAVSKSGNYGIDISYMEEQWTRDSFVGVDAPAIDIDVNYTFPIGPNDLFGATNPNFGRLYYYAPSSNRTVNDDEREAARATAFAKFDFGEKFDGGIFKWLGRHNVTGLFDDNTVTTRRVITKPYVFGNDAGFHLQNNNATIFQRQWSGIFYISDAYPQAFEDPSFQLSDFSTVGSAPNTQFDFPDGYQTPVAYLSVGDPTTDASANSVLGDETTEIGQFTPAFQPFTGALTKNTTTSAALNLQSFLLNDLFVANLGWRSDEVSLTRNGNPPVNADLTAIVTEDLFTLDGIETRTEKQNNFSYGLVMKVPTRFVPEGTSLSFHYGQSDNFIANPGGFDIEGNSVPNASGSTEDYGVTVGLMDNKLVARFNKYKGSVENENYSGTTRATGLYINAAARNFGAFWVEMDDRDQNRDGIFDFVVEQDPNDATQTILVDPDANRNGFLDTIEPGGADYVAGNEYIFLADFTTVFNAWDNWWNDYARATAEMTFTPKTALEGASYTSAQGLSAVLSDTVDLVAEGYEFELTYNPSRNLRLSFNAAQQSSVRSNIAPRLGKMLQDLVDNYAVASQGLRIVGNSDTRLDDPLASTDLANNTTADAPLRAGTIGQVFFIQEALAGSDSPEIREYRANFLGNYTFSDGRFKGANVGAAFRWQDQAAIGYPLAFKAIPGTDAEIPIKDVANPYFDQGSEYFDLWVGYRRKIFSDKIDWKIQLSIRNVFVDSDPVVVQVQPDGSPARVALPVSRQFVLSNTFTF
jgi:hypothetical protein